MFHSPLNIDLNATLKDKPPNQAKTWQTIVHTEKLDQTSKRTYPSQVVKLTSYIEMSIISYSVHTPNN